MKKIKEVLKPQGELDVLYYYSQTAKHLGKFLKNKKIATKIHLPKGNTTFFLKRGSNSSPLFIQDFLKINEKILDLRKGHHLDDVKDKLTQKQQIIWRYFPPRKPIQFFYATNNEGVNKPIDRVFIDIDRQSHSSEDARKVCLELVNTINSDKKFNKLLNFKTIIMWTGSSFHIYLLLKKPINLNFYNKYLSYGNKKPDSFIIKWASIISEKTKIKIKAGHERQKDAIILDSSNTPSGKLARAPFSLHINFEGKIDGISVPLAKKQLQDNLIVKKLKNLAPEKVLKNLKSYEKLL